MSVSNLVGLQTSVEEAPLEELPLSHRTLVALTRTFNLARLPLSTPHLNTSLISLPTNESFL